MLVAGLSLRPDRRRLRVVLHVPVRALGSLRVGIVLLEHLTGAALVLLVHRLGTVQTVMPASELIWVTHEASSAVSLLRELVNLLTEEVV